MGKFNDLRDFYPKDSFKKAMFVAHSQLSTRSTVSTPWSESSIIIFHVAVGCRGES